jgi:hypothetical protein
MLNIYWELKYLSTGMNAQFYVGVQSGIANIQSDVKGVTVQEIEVHLKQVIFIFNRSHWYWVWVEFAQYKQKIFLNQGSTTNFEVDATGSAFSYSVTTGNYKESQTVQAIQIPLFLQYKKILIRELILISGQVLSIFYL